jgi:hypothetical protein
MAAATTMLTQAAAPLLAVLPPVAWLPHRLVRKPDGNLDKPPCQGARTNAPETWFTFEAASALLTGQNDVAGIGFAIVAGIIALDFDHCRDPLTGLLDDEVQREVERLESYAYVTPSHTGIRIVGLNDRELPLPGGKHVRWLPGGHKIEIFVGPVSFYNTFTAETIAGYDTLRTIVEDTSDYLTGLDAGKAGAVNGAATHTTHAPNPDPQRSAAAIAAALACIPNTVKDWDEWCRIGMAAWRASGGRGAGLDAWMGWSARNACHDPAACEERWQHWFSSPPTKIGFGTLYYEARRHKPLFVAPFDPPQGPVDEADAEGRATDGDLPFKKRVRPPPAILTIAELLALPPPQWLVAGLIPEQALVVPYGPPKSGKSFLMMSAALHIAAGRDWFGHAVQQGAVVYVMGEGIGGMGTRIRAMLTRYDMAPDVPFFIVRRAVNFRDPAEVNALEEVIRARIGDMPLRLLVIDTLARAMPGADENSAQETGAVIAAADYLKEELHCTVALVHHEGKDGSRGARGTSALRGAWDAAYQIVSSGRRMTLTVIDQKEGEAGQVLRFNMEEVAVGIGRTSLVPVLDDNPDPDMAGQKPVREITGHAGLVLRALQDVMAGPESAVLPPFDGLPQGDVRGVPVEVLRRKVYERMPTVSQEARQKAFVRSVQNLMRMRAIGVRDPWVWLV